MSASPAKELRVRRLKNLRYRLRRHAAAYVKLLRAGLGPGRVLPDFLIIGAMKSGTSSLFHTLQQHPGIASPSTKEIHFLDNPVFYRFGEAWYRSHFPTRNAMAALSNQLGYRAVSGEGTPAMISNFYAINAGRHLPRARLIAVLRNPVDRAYSHYHHMRRSIFGEPLSFWDALQAEQSRTAHDIWLDHHAPQRAGRKHKLYSYGQRGMYIDQLENWLRYFPRERLKLLHYDELIADTGGMCNEVAEFLGLPPHNFDAPQRRNTGHYTEPMDTQCREYLTELFRPYNRRLFEFLGEDWGWPA